MIRNLIRRMAELAWYPCRFCGWPIPEGGDYCVRCNNGTNIPK